MQILDKINKENISDAFALSMTKFFRFTADTFFAKRYGHRAVVLETVAGVPGMVAGVWMHFKSLRAMKAGYGEQIREMLAEAENERMHLMFFIEIAKPNIFERLLVTSAQIVFGLFYLLKAEEIPSPWLKLQCCIKGWFHDPTCHWLLIYNDHSKMFAT